MTLAPGTRLGPYEVVETLGAGGMGEVYRARDAKLGRDVAVKTLPPEVAADAERLRRFEREARAASALNHPNIVTIHDVDTASSVAWMAMELVEGRTLRQLLESGPLAGRRLLEVAAQIADGLARAHEAGIVHRDLKPENVMVRKDGFVKILDFGLAKLTPLRDESSDPAEIDTIRDQTKPGTVMGTVGYMSPEQASGKPADFRSDQFSLGAILYELASGKRAFQRATAPQTLAAVIQDEPEPLAAAAPRLAPPVRWVVERCLAKEPDGRYAATRDLARELATLRDRLSEATSSRTGVPSSAPRRARRAAGALLAGAALFAAGRASVRPAMPVFERLTFRRGAVGGARFASDGRTVVYGARWGGAPREVYSTVPGSPESRLLTSNAVLCDVSSRGELALVSTAEDVRRRRILSRAPLSGGAPRPVAENVHSAAWLPDGADLAVVPEGRRIELPPGTPVYTSKRWINMLRVSRSGRRLAFLEHDDTGNPSILVIDRKGRVESRSSGWRDASGLAFTPDERELWFAASELGSATELRALSLSSGRVRRLAAIPGSVALHDIAPDGRVLLSHDNFANYVVGRAAGEAHERDLSWFDGSMAEDLSADGRKVLITEGSEGAGKDLATYVRAMDGSPAVRLGPGRASAFSPDGSWVAGDPPGEGAPRLLLTPTGPGTPRTLDLAPVAESPGEAAWFPDGKRLAVQGSAAARPARCWEVDAVRGGARPLTPEGIQGLDGRCTVSPDGTRLLVDDRRKNESVASPALFHLATGALEPLPAPEPGEEGWRFASDGASLLAHRHAGDWKTLLFRLRLADRRREPIRDLVVEDDAGLVVSPQPVIAADGVSYAYTITRMTGDLYLATGLR